VFIPDFYGILDKAKQNLHNILGSDNINDIKDIINVNKGLMSKDV